MCLLQRGQKGRAAQDFQRRRHDGKKREWPLPPMREKNQGSANSKRKRYLQKKVRRSIARREGGAEIDLRWPEKSANSKRREWRPLRDRSLPSRKNTSFW